MSQTHILKNLNVVMKSAEFRYQNEFLWQEISLKNDFQDNYPKTVRETVKLHCRYMKLAYNNEFSKDELIDANKKIREAKPIIRIKRIIVFSQLRNV